MASFVQNVRVDHGRADVLVAQQLLNRADVIARFQKMRGEGMPKCMASGPLRQSRRRNSLPDRFLNQRFVHVMPPLFTGFRVLPAVFLGEYPLPAPFLRGVGVFAVEGVGQEHAAPTVGQIALVDRSDALEAFLQRGLERLGQHGDAVFGALAVADEDFVTGEVEILHAQPQAFHEPQPGAVHQRGHEPLVAGEVRQHGLDLLPRHHNGEPPGLAGADDLAQVPDFSVENMTIEEQQGRKRLVLRRSGDLFLDRQMRQKGVYLRFAHLGGMAQVVKMAIPLYPMAIGLLGSGAVVARTHGLAKPIKQFGLADRPG